MSEMVTCFCHNEENLAFWIIIYKEEKTSIQEGWSGSDQAQGNMQGAYIYQDSGRYSAWRYWKEIHSSSHFACCSLKLVRMLLSRTLGGIMKEHKCLKDLKDLLVGKASKKSPLLWRMLLLIFAMLCGIYICFFCFKQRSTHVKPKYVLPRQEQREESSCQMSDAGLQKIVHRHYPQPTTYSRKECACTPVHFFAILSMQRSGSGWFETLLNSHPNISSNGEIFSVKERRHNISTILETLDKVYSMEWLSSAAKNECSAAIGFKWMLNQGAMEYNRDIVNYFIKRGVSVILLFRRNLLRRLISVLANAYDREAKLLNGTHKSHVHSKQEAELLAAYKPEINVTFLIANLNRIEEVTRDAVEFFKSTHHIVLYYEDLINDQKKMVEVQEFLNVPPRQLKSQQVKIHTRPLSDHVQNWNEVYKKLKGTKYEIFLNESDYDH